MTPPPSAVSSSLTCSLVDHTHADAYEGDADDAHGDSDDEGDGDDDVGDAADANDDDEGDDGG
eukprot:10845454-Karenia_brevis.AAC.1